MIHSIFLAGLGGQGVLTVAGILADHATEAGFRVSLFNAKGMAQRGGRVTSEVRLARDPQADFGARISAGAADVLVGMEIGETINSLPFLREGGAALVLNYAYVPAETVLKKQPYPSFAEACSLFAARKAELFALEQPAAPHNVFVLGALAATVPTAVGALAFYTPESLEQTVARKLKRGLQENLQAFRQGCVYGRSLLGRA